MKKYFYFLTVLLVLGVGFSSCKDDDTAYQSLLVAPHSLEFATTGDTQHVTLLINETTWDYTTPASWVKVELDPKNTAREAKILITLEPNTDENSRTTQLVFNGCRAEDAVVNIKQRGTSEEAFIHTETENLRFSSTPQTLTLTVDSEYAKWTVEPSDDWISWEKDSKNPDLLKVTALENDRPTAREGSITIKSDHAGTITIPVQQYANKEKNPFIWERSNRFFAKLLGKVSFISKTTDPAEDIYFDPDGYITHYKGTEKIDKTTHFHEVTYTYDLNRRLTQISSPSYEVTLKYNDNEHYIEVEDHVFYKIGLGYLYVHSPKFIKGLEAITVVGDDETLDFTFQFTDNKMMTYINGEMPYMASKYEGMFPVTAAQIESKEDKKGNKLTETKILISVFNPENGKLVNTARITKSEYNDKSLENPKDEIRATKYLDDKYNNMETSGNTNFTYDEFGDNVLDKLLIGGSPTFINYSYKRDSKNNWTNQTSIIEIFGEKLPTNIVREIKYFD